MPIQLPQWTEYLSCPVCENGFDLRARPPISLGCGHSVCKACLANLQRAACPFDQVRNIFFKSTVVQIYLFHKFIVTSSFCGRWRPPKKSTLPSSRDDLSICFLPKTPLQLETGFPVHGSPLPIDIPLFLSVARCTIFWDSTYFPRSNVQE